MTRQKARFITIALIVGILVLLTPWRIQIVPAWKLRVIDENGKPISALTVSQTWVDPNCRFFWLEEDYRTDGNGLVNFPERYTWQNIFLRVAAPIWNRLYSPTLPDNYDATAFGWGDYAYGQVYYRRGQLLPETLVMYR